MQSHLSNFLPSLLEIQKIDLAIRDFEQKYEATPVRLKQLENSVKQLRTDISKIQEEKEQNSREIKILENLIQAESQKIRKWETRLNDIRNQREYVALSREIESSKKANREAEEKILELMSKKESYETTLESLQDRIAEEDADSETERTAVNATLAEYTSQIEAAKNKRGELLPNIPAPIIQKYEMVRKKRFGLGVVAVIEGSCSGCNMKLPPQLYNTLQKGEKIEQCPICHRLIFWDKFLENLTPEVTVPEAELKTPQDAPSAHLG